MQRIGKVVMCAIDRVYVHVCAIGVVRAAEPGLAVAGGVDACVQVVPDVSDKHSIFFHDVVCQAFF